MVGNICCPTDMNNMRRGSQQRMGCLQSSRLTQKTRIILKIVFDIICVFLVAAGIFAIKFGSKPYHRGFFCDDESIKHPVLEDTISVSLAACIGVLIPLAVIIILEFLLRKNTRAYAISVKKFSGKNRSWIDSTYNSLAVFIFGMAVTQFLTEVGKYSIGRLRPHFLTLCNPDMRRVNCSAGYITEDVCTSTDTSMMTEARLSFPSGHSSFSMYCMLYLILYLQARISFQAVTLLKPLVQLVLFSLGFFTCLSRISDYKHHWSDVLSGSVLGMAVCVFVILSLADFGQFFWIRGAVNGIENEALVPSGNQTVEEGTEVSYNARSHHESQQSRQVANRSNPSNIQQIYL